MAGKKTYVQCPETGKFIEKSKFLAQGSHAVHVMQPFVSPVDGTVIRDASQLRAHNRKHGVTDQRDYGSEWFARKGRENDLKRQSLDPKSKRDRIEALKRATQHIRT